MAARESPGAAHQRRGPSRPERTTSMAEAETPPPLDTRWGTYPTRFQSTVEGRATEAPKSSTPPRVMGAVPSRARRVVDLPEPFAPVRATAWPAGMAKSTPWRTRSMSHATWRLEARTTAGAAVVAAPAPWAPDGEASTGN